MLKRGYLYRRVRESLTNKMMFALLHKTKGLSHVDILGKHTAGRRHGKDVGPKLREYLVCSRSNRKASIEREDGGRRCDRRGGGQG